MWRHPKRLAAAAGALAAGLGITAAAGAADAPVPQAPPRAGLAAKPTSPGATGAKRAAQPAPPGMPAGAAPPAARNPPAEKPPPAPSATPPAADAPAQTIAVRGDRLTVQVSELPLDEVLRRIAESSKADIRGAVATPRTVTAEFDDVPLQDGLTRLLGDQNFLLTYRVDGRLRRLTLLGGPVEQTAETRVVKTTPQPAPPPPPKTDWFQKRVPVKGRLKSFVGQDTATLQQLMDIAVRQDDTALRYDAATTGMRAVDTDPDVRAAVVKSLEGPNSQTLEALLRTLAPDRAQEILTHMMGSSMAELRTRGMDLARRMRDAPATQAAAP